MYAVRLHAFGPAGNLRYEEVGDPVAGPGQVRIRVHAAGVHVIDTRIRAGDQGGPMPPPGLPTIPGREVAGVVDGVGPGVDEAWVGRRVVAHLGMAPGGYAELAVRDVEAVHELPGHVDYAAAVAMIGTGRTTMGILEIAELRSDDVVLVAAAAGGIGNLLVQAARNAGATVVGLAGGADKVARVRAAGATYAVDYRAPGWPDEVRSLLAGREPTVGLEGVGGEIGQGMLDLLGAGGRLVMYGWAAGSGPTQVTGEKLYAGGLTASAAIGPRLLRRAGGLRPLETQALAALAEGALVPVVQSFPLREAATAHGALETRATVGKVVLVP
jgi:NADPH2:quinone reductase